jgi:hypothetical protein
MKIILKQCPLENSEKEKPWIRPNLSCTKIVENPNPQNDNIYTKTENSCLKIVLKHEILQPILSPSNFLRMLEYFRNFSD